MPLVDWGLVSLDAEECRRLLAESELGRVGLSVDALPIILPVNYRVIDDRVTFWTAPGLKLDAARSGTVVSFEVDGVGSGDGGWSVLVIGIAREVTDQRTVARVEAAGLRPRPRGERHHLIQLEEQFISGRSIGLPRYHAG